MPMRRRPLRRVAVTGAVGAAAYNAGKNKSATQPAPTPALEAAPAPTGAAPVAEPTTRTEIYEAIAKLGELKDQGLLSDEEFQREKIRLLDR